MADVQVKKKGDATVIVIDRPAVKNALDKKVIEKLHSVLDQHEGVLVITGGGETFVSGADISELAQRRRADALARINSGLFRRIEQHPMPVIAAINGHALGGGLELALACDIRVAHARAKFGQPEVGLGIIPGAGATYRLPRIVGLGRAKELILTARLIDAEEALRIGLVSAVGEDALALALDFASRLGKQSALALRLAKSALDAAYAPVETGMALESAAQAVLFEDEEKARRMARFLGKGKK